MECYESLVNLPATCSASDAEKHSPTLTLLGHSVMQGRMEHGCSWHQGGWRSVKPVQVAMEFE